MKLSHILNVFFFICIDQICYESIYVRNLCSMNSRSRITGLFAVNRQARSESNQTDKIQLYSDVGIFGMFITPMSVIKSSSISNQFGQWNRFMNKSELTLILFRIIEIAFVWPPSSPIFHSNNMIDDDD